jgi:pimeloyl-ACP methyl ester carboxylesterase
MTNRLGHVRDLLQPDVCPSGTPTVVPDATVSPRRSVEDRRPLAEIQTPVQIIAGARDPLVPPVNGEFLDERLPRSKLDIIDAGHFTWEDAADEYAALVTAWWGGGYATAGASADRCARIPDE